MLYSGRHATGRPAALCPHALFRHELLLLLFLLIPDEI
jgi:hypothetical protein